MAKRKKGKKTVKKKKRKNKSLNRNKLALTVIFIVTITVICVMFVNAELSEFSEDGVTPIDYVKADDGNLGDNQLEKTHKDNESPDDKSKETVKNTTDNSEITTEVVDPYYEMINNSDRINILCFGLAEYLLADTVMIVSLDVDENTADVISIPRDTYYYTEGREDSWMKKINSYYHGDTVVDRTQLMINSVSDLVKLPINYYVKIRYAGVEGIIDCIGGVKTDIPFDMNYDDPADDLHIHFKAGVQTLNGKEAVEYLRFRKNNDGTHSDGDIGRIYRQQEFVKNAIRKSLSLNILNVVNVAQNYVKTNMQPGDMIAYAKKIMDIEIKNINFHTLPGSPKDFDGGDYWVADKQKAKEMIMDIYKGIDK